MPTFDMLLNKYVHQAGSRMSQQYGKRPRSLSTERSYRHQDSAGDTKRQVTRQTVQSRLVYPGDSSYWRVKEQGTKVADIESRVIPDRSLIIGTHVLKLKDPVAEPSSGKPILAIVPKVTEAAKARSSQTEIVETGSSQIGRASCRERVYVLV